MAKSEHAVDCLINKMNNPIAEDCTCGVNTAVPEQASTEPQGESDCIVCGASGTHLYEGSLYCETHFNNFGSTRPAERASVSAQGERSKRIRDGLKLDGTVHIPEWPSQPNAGEVTQEERVRISNQVEKAILAHIADDDLEDNCSIAVALRSREAQIRLDEAKWWAERVSHHGFSLHQEACILCKRLALLAAKSKGE